MVAFYTNMSKLVGVIIVTNMAMLRRALEHWDSVCFIVLVPQLLVLGDNFQLWTQHLLLAVPKRSRVLRSNLSFLWNSSVLPNSLVSLQ